MRVKQIIQERFEDYKKPNLFICSPTCTFKCCIEAGIPISVCQNCEVSNMKTIDVSIKEIIESYLSNKITSSIVFGGLEPMDSFLDILNFLTALREEYLCNDDVVIYTGYYKHEIIKEIEFLKRFKNIIMKYGRYVPNDTPHYDNVIGVTLANKEQYGEKIS
jgi:hypothetical protein